MFHAVGALALLYVFWLLLSGYFTAFLMTAGAASAVAVLLFSRRMGILDREGIPLHLILRTVVFYWPWLVKEIIKAAWDVSKRILDPRLPITPTLVRFRPSQRSTVGIVIHANSITLTPGTISVEVGRDEFLVHSLTAEGAASLEGSEMDRRVTALESAG